LFLAALISISVPVSMGLSSRRSKHRLCGLRAREGHFQSRFLTFLKAVRPCGFIGGSAEPPFVTPKATLTRILGRAGCARDAPGTHWLS
jgi:hypothetical protein